MENNQAAWEYRSLDHISDLEMVVELEIMVWGLHPKDAVPANILYAIAHAGGLVVGAFEKSRLIGMALAFPARRQNEWLLWSHMTAVHPDYQGIGVGFGLKQFQRVWAIQHHYQTISWTFDPLQPGNAKFNLHHLDATAKLYHVNFYGEMTDSINAGLPSDRLEVRWDLRARRSPKKQVKLSTEMVTALKVGDDAHPVVLNNLSADTNIPLWAEIPSNMSIIRRNNPDLALAWRLALRQILQTAFEMGYTATDFLALNNQSGYVLSPQKPWFLYILECSDQSLYTGITLDLGRRLVAHNAGRGAAYTASRRPVRLVAAWRFSNQPAALKAEKAFKQQPRQLKLALISGHTAYREAPPVEIEKFIP